MCASIDVMGKRNMHLGLVGVHLMSWVRGTCVYKIVGVANMLRETARSYLDLVYAQL